MFLKMNDKSFNVKCLVLGVLLLAIIVLQWHNINSYPLLKRGFDTLGHIEYINYLKINKMVPLPNKGWELWQPPLYYFLATLFKNISDVKFLNFSSWIVLVCVSFIFFKKTFKNLQIGLLGSFIVASLPAVLYLVPPISNEFFSAVLISLGMIYYLLHQNLNNTLEKVILGTFLGLSCLAKATAFILVFSIFIDQIFQNKLNVIKLTKKLFLPFLTMAIICGWFYIRNIYFFKNPFISSFDFPRFAFSQAPGYRDLRFFTDLSGFFKLDLFYAHHYSFWAGTYFSWFYDGHNVIIPVQKFSKAGTTLVIFSIPLFIFSIIGYFDELKKNYSNKNKLLIIYPVILFFSYILYNFKLPFYSTVKASFITSAIIPWGYFTLKGILYLNKKSFNNIIVFYIFIYCLLIIKNFWILPNWYR